jgi:alanine racemase
MDLTIVDLSAAPQAALGDEAILLGERQGAADIARQCGTITYEVLCGISKRVPRLYLD